MADSHRKILSSLRPGATLDRLDRAVAFHRATLATPVEEHFMTQEQLQRMPPPPEPEPQWRDPTKFLITRVMMTVEVPVEARAEVISATRWPIAGIMTLRQMKDVRNVLAPGFYILPSPLTDSERTELSVRQERQLRDFDESVTKTRLTLVRLAEIGADPLFVLSVLVRYMPMKGTEVPKDESVVLQSSDFGLRVLSHQSPNPLAQLADWDAGRINKIPLRLEAGKTRPAQPRRRRKPGPAEAAPSIGMALLAQPPTTAGRQAHIGSSEIADLVRVWAPWIRGDAYLVGKHVYNRIRRIRVSRDFRLTAREEEIRYQTEAALLASHFASP
jgi:hypothetical protein